MNKIEINILSKKENIMIARAIVTAFMLTCNTTVAYTNEVKTIVSEAITNAIVHGYELNTDEFVKLTLEYNAGVIHIEIVDNGVGIEDVELAKEAMYTSKPEEDRSGLGFTIIELFSDSYEVISAKGQGTIVRCQKKILELVKDAA